MACQKINLQIFYDDTLYKFRGWRKFKKLVDELIKSEGKVIGEISFIITYDNYLRNVNKEFLNHDYFTDVISFNYSFANNVIGEIYISEDTMRRNSIEYNVDFDNEMLRVMIHGVLHLAGYDDRTKAEKQKMRQLEDKWMKLFFEEFKQSL
jgi:rRNA maturation RNase YbeY